MLSEKAFYYLIDTWFKFEGPFFLFFMRIFFCFHNFVLGLRILEPTLINFHTII